MLESHLRLTMYVLCCFNLDVLRLTRATPRTERPIRTEQCPGRRLQIPHIFLHTSDSHLCLNFFSDQPNHAEINMASPKRLYTCCIFFYSTCYIYCPLSTRSNGKYDYFMLLYDKKWGTRQLSYRDGLFWTPSLFIFACLSCAFVDGSRSWASRAVAWVQSNRSSTKTFFSVGFSLLQPAY